MILFLLIQFARSNFLLQTLPLVQGIEFCTSSKDVSLHHDSQITLFWKQILLFMMHHLQILKMDRGSETLSNIMFFLCQTPIFIIHYIDLNDAL
jgi:hypothetical protein